MGRKYECRGTASPGRLVFHSSSGPNGPTVSWFAPGNAHFEDVYCVNPLGFSEQSCLETVALGATATIVSALRALCVKSVRALFLSRYCNPTPFATLRVVPPKVTGNKSGIARAIRCRLTSRVEVDEQSDVLVESYPTPFAVLRVVPPNTNRAIDSFHALRYLSWSS